LPSRLKPAVAARATPAAAAPAAPAVPGAMGALLAEHGIVVDPAQAAAVARLERLSLELGAFRAARQSRIKRLFAKPAVPRGLYLWGGVGRGKSLLMDAFYATVPIRRRTRVHFHAFMRDIHDELATLKREVDPLATVAAHVARRWRLVCFDEFHVSDIADAMILGRLLTALFGHGVVLVLTSNYRPDALYANGLQRQNFVPTIRLLERELDVLEVEGGTDYRLRALSQVRSYLVPADREAEAELAAAFERMRSGPDESPRLAIEGRTLIARHRAGSAVWFDFAALCDGPRSQRDYLELAREFSVMFVSGIPRLTAEMGDRARRFTWLVDILYDHRVKLLVSAAVAPERLYEEGPNSREFPRTVSRLVEMQSREYMAQPHVAAAQAA
jgi:cell division protein ZapE